MGSISLHTSGSAAVHVAWERYTDSRQWSMWSPQISRVTTDGRHRIVPGLIGTVHGPAGAAVQFVVLDVDDAERTWTWQVAWGPVRLHLEHAVTATETGSATTLTIRGPLPVILAYAPLARLALHRLVAG